MNLYSRELMNAYMNSVMSTHGFLFNLQVGLDLTNKEDEAFFRAVVTAADELILSAQKFTTEADKLVSEEDRLGDWSEPYR